MRRAAQSVPGAATPALRRVERACLDERAGKHGLEQAGGKGRPSVVRQAIATSGRMPRTSLEPSAR